MGPAVSPAISLACTLAKEHEEEVEIMSVETGTSSVVDDVYPVDVDEDVGQRVRNKSTIKISFEIRKVKKEVVAEGEPVIERKLPAFVHYQRKPKARRIHK
jgi:hypothetical protein